ncbi:SOSS complex subunit B1 [Dissophora globulifera]|nr:SOSS complex subunit B1 [Dissophora globulifera]
MNRPNLARGPGPTGTGPNSSTPGLTNSSTGLPALQLTPIGDVRPSMRGFNLECILLEKAAEPRRVFDNQTLSTFLAADKTGSIVLIIWGEAAKLLRSGDIVRIQGAEAKLFKGHIQISTSRYGKYKRIGEDTMLFFEKPNWSECDWIQDEHNRSGPMVPINPTTKVPMVPMANGNQPMTSVNGVLQQQQQRTGNAPPLAPSFNPAFRGDQRPGQRPFPPNQGGNPMTGPGQGPPGFSHKGSFGGPGGAPSNMQHTPQHLQPQIPGGPGSNILPGGPTGPPQPQPLGGNRQHHGQYPGHGNNQQNQNQNQNHNHNHNHTHNNHSQKPPGGGGGGGSGHSNGHGPNPRHGKHGKHNKIHRDLDAPDSYPSPRTGLANSADDFARDMRLVSQGGTGLGMAPVGHGINSVRNNNNNNNSMGAGAGPSGPGHVRKKPKVEME